MKKPVVYSENMGIFFKGKHKHGALLFAAVLCALLVIQVGGMFLGIKNATAKGLPTSHASDNDLVVLVLVDAMRADHMGIYGYKKPTTPNFDTFAKEGVRYTKMYVNAPWTRPSTASFLTGQNATHHTTETYRSKLPASVTTIAQRMKKAGYTTGGFTANGNGGSLAGLQKGFDIFEDPSTTYKRKMRGKTYCCNGLPSGEFLNKRIKRWLKKTAGQKRFLFIFYVDPHDPYGAPAALEKMFLPKGLKGEPKRKALWEHNNDYSEIERQSLLGLYDAGIRYADQSFGKLMTFLKKRGEYDKATIMVSADHGEGFGEHNFYLHAHHFWEEVIHVPLLVRGPGFTAGVVSDRLTQSLDVARTIAAVGDADETSLPGVSLLEGELEAQKAPYVISEYNEFGIHRQAIVSTRYKVIWQRPADEAWYMREARDKKYFPSVSFDKEVIHIFDLQADPKERQNLSANPPVKAAKLLQILRDFVAPSIHK